MNTILAINTGKKVTDIERDTDRDYFMSAKESLEYGIIDKIL
ncbi:MAG: ATP-dependent Clp protease proteolytic subunit [Bacilli bacterium]|nr:ATP-dependent Clp protease proteolytic subunit [Bacilli bacterium]